MRTIIKTVCLLVSLSFATQTQAQTKEETIAWLKEKIEKCIYGGDNTKNLKLQSIDECKMVFTYTMYGSNYKHILPTAIKKIDLGLLWYSSEVAINQEEGKEADFFGVSHFSIEDREENIRERVEKALKHLATFCSKKQETF